MGIGISNINPGKLKNINAIYRVKLQDIEMLKKVWEVVGSDLDHYGSTLRNTFFHNHPEYVKYFQCDVRPEFVQDAKIKSKFSTICGIMSSLILDYFNKPHERDYILGFIAMMHKDMQLTLTDFENFLSDFLEMLLRELPTLMTAEHIVAQTHYFGALIQRINYLMIIHRENDLTSNYKYDYVFQTLCGWSRNQPTMYGRPIDYWEARKFYWNTRVVLWSRIEPDLPGSTTAFLVRRKFQEINSTNRKTKRDSRALIYSQPSSSASTTSSVNPEPSAVKYRRRSSEKNLRRNSMTPRRVSQMETISEGRECDREFNINQNVRRASIKKTEAFIHALEALKSARKSSDSDHFSNLREEKKEEKTDKTARERRRLVTLQRVRYAINEVIKRIKWVTSS